jgi:hypothetical protein
MQPTTVPRMAPDLFEFQSAIRNSILSRIQVSILAHRAEDATCHKLCSDYRICNQEALSQCFVRTALGFHWSRACQGGPLSFLSDLDIHTLEEVNRNRSEYNGSHLPRRTELPLSP